MVYKDEVTALLLTQDELSVEDHRKVKCAKHNLFIAATLAVSCLCGAGIFIATDKVWCYEPVIYRESDLLRFYVLIGGILSAFLTGRAVDFFGRRSSVMFSAMCWLLSAVFLSYFAIFRMNSQSPLGEISTQLLQSHQPSELSHTLNNYSGKYIHVPQSLLVNPLPTKAASVYSLSSKNLNGSNVPERHHGMWYFSSSPCGRSRIDCLSSIDVNEQPIPLIPQIITSLLIGCASTASIVSASVYLFEITGADVRARSIALSDFFCAVFGIFFPVISCSTLTLVVVTCLPVIILSILSLLPVKVPNYLSLPNSPYHLILKSIIQKRNLHEKNNAGNTTSEGTSKNCVYNFLNYFSYSSKKTPFSFTHIIKPPFYIPKSKIYDLNSRKNSVSDSEDVSFCMNDVVKQSEQELDLDKSLTVSAESQELYTNYPRVGLEEDPHCNGSMKLVKDGITDCCNSDHDEGVITFGSTPKDHEARKTLGFLYGICEGDDEAEAIHKEFLMDTDAGSLCKNESYFDMQKKNFHPISHTVLKLGFPLLIIHMCATDYSDIATLTGAALSKLSICGSTAAAAVSMLKVISAALSMLFLDKIGHRSALLSAATVLGITSLLLGFLSPHVMPDVEDSPNTATTLPALPTMYPLLPTPLPQLLHGGDSSHLDTHLFGGRALHSYTAFDSPVIWLTLILVISLIASGSILLAPLTRMCILSSFPTCNRGSGMGFIFAMQYIIHLITFYLPCAYFSSSSTLLFRSGACFASIILLLCFFETKNQGQRSSLQRYSFNKKFHLLFNGKICNMSTANSTAV